MISLSKLSQGKKSFDKEAAEKGETVGERLEEEGSWSEVVAVPSVLIFGVLAKVKLRLARELDSGVLYEDGVCSALVGNGEGGGSWEEGISGVFCTKSKWGV